MYPDSLYSIRSVVYLFSPPQMQPSSQVFESNNNSRRALITRDIFVQLRTFICRPISYPTFFTIVFILLRSKHLRLLHSWRMQRHDVIHVLVLNDKSITIIAVCRCLIRKAVNILRVPDTRNRRPFESLDVAISLRKHFQSLRHSFGFNKRYLLVHVTHWIHTHKAYI